MDVTKLAIVAARVAANRHDGNEALRGRIALKKVVQGGRIDIIRGWHTHQRLPYDKGSYIDYHRPASEFADAEPSTSDTLGCGLVHLAVQSFAENGGKAHAQNCVDLVRALVTEMGCDVNGIDLTGRTPLHYLARTVTDRVYALPPAAMVDLLVHQLGADPDRPDAAGYTPLMLMSSKKLGNAASAAETEFMLELVKARRELPPDSAEGVGGRSIRKALSRMDVHASFFGRSAPSVSILKSSAGTAAMTPRDRVAMAASGVGFGRPPAASSPRTGGTALDFSDVGVHDVSTDSESSSSPSPKKLGQTVDRGGTLVADENGVAAITGMLSNMMSSPRAGLNSSSRSIMGAGGASADFEYARERERLERVRSSSTLWMDVPLAALEQARLAERTDGTRRGEWEYYAVLLLDRRPPIEVVPGGSAGVPSNLVGTPATPQPSSRLSRIDAQRATSAAYAEVQRVTGRLPPTVEVRRIQPLSGSSLHANAVVPALQYSEDPETGYCVAVAIGPFLGAKGREACAQCSKWWSYCIEVSKRLRVCVGQCCAEVCQASAVPVAPGVPVMTAAEQEMTDADYIAAVDEPKPPQIDKHTVYKWADQTTWELSTCADEALRVSETCLQRHGQGACEWSAVACAYLLGGSLTLPKKELYGRVPDLLRPFVLYARWFMTRRVLCNMGWIGARGATEFWNSSIVRLCVAEYGGRRGALKDTVSLSGSKEKGAEGDDKPSVNALGASPGGVFAGRGSPSKVAQDSPMKGCLRASAGPVRTGRMHLPALSSPLASNPSARRGPLAPGGTDTAER